MIDRRLARRVLLAPRAVRWAASRSVQSPEELWMLRQPRHVRESFVREVLDAGGDDRLQEIWMLRQDDHVRESYAREVLGADAERPPALR